MTFDVNTVQKLLTIDFTGDVIPKFLYHRIRSKNGNSDLLAVLCLSRILYWCRPQLITDPETGIPIGYKRKFKYDCLQLSYKTLAKYFQYSVRSVKEALALLESLGVITRELRTLELDMGTLPNVLFIHLHVEKVLELQASYAAEVAQSAIRSNIHPEIIPISDLPVVDMQKANPVMSYTTQLDSDRGDVKTEDRLQKNVRHPTENCQTYTKISTQSSQKTAAEQASVVQENEMPILAAADEKLNALNSENSDTTLDCQKQIQPEKPMALDEREKYQASENPCRQANGAPPAEISQGTVDTPAEKIVQNSSVVKLTVSQAEKLSMLRNPHSANQNMLGNAEPYIGPTLTETQIKHIQHQAQSLIPILHQALDRISDGIVASLVDPTQFTKCGRVFRKKLNAILKQARLGNWDIPQQPVIPKPADQEKQRLLEALQAALIEKSHWETMCGHAKTKSLEKTHQKYADLVRQASEKIATCRAEVASFHLEQQGHHHDASKTQSKRTHANKYDSDTATQRPVGINPKPWGGDSNRTPHISERYLCEGTTG